MSRAVERNKAQNHLERDPPGTNACWTKVCLVLPPPSRYKNRQPETQPRRAWCHGLAEHSDIVHPVSSSQLTEARNRVRSFGGYNIPQCQSAILRQCQSSLC